MLPRYVCNVVVHYFRNISAEYPNTRFIVNSTILTSSVQLNGIILTLNKCIEGNNNVFESFSFISVLVFPKVFVSYFTYYFCTEESSAKLPNFHFFNSLKIMCEYDYKGYKVYIDMDRFGVGIHISDRAV